MNLTKFTGLFCEKHKPQPCRMAVGESVERINPCYQTRRRTIIGMRKGMKMGMEFSIGYEPDDKHNMVFIIRRDK